MENKSINLKIYNILDIQENGLQKCLIPQEYFTNGLSPGALAKCKTEKEEIFLCYIFSLRNDYPKSHCFLDDSVKIASKFSIRNSTKIMTITQITEDVIKATQLNAMIEANGKLFDITITKNLLAEILKEWLTNYTLYENCTIKSDEFLKLLGVESITVDSNLKGPFELTSDTKIVLSDVQYKENILKCSELKGLDSTMTELDKLIVDFNLQKQTNWRMKPSFNALLIGPTGCGKTSLCHNLFLKNECNVFNIQPSDIIRQYPGETEQVLRNIYNNVEKFIKIFNPKHTTIIFIENIDILCPATLLDTDSHNITLISSQIYSILDDLHSRQIDAIVIATTSQIDKVNIQLRRPERFEKEIQIFVPSAKEREDILKLFLKTTPIENIVTDEMIMNIAEKTPGFVGADLMLIVQNLLQLIMLQMKTFEINQEQLNNFLNIVLKTSKTASIQSCDIQVYKCDENFDNIGGANKLKNILKLSILTPLRKPEVFKKFGLQLPKGILLYGPPGCAKTTVAKCLANETKMTFISISGAEVYSPYVGNAEKYITKIFDTARRNSPCLIFFDEIETLVGKRTLNSKSDVQTRILSTLLQEMDGIGLKIDEGIKTHQNENNILVIGATNRPDMIDDALLRPGRFDKLIHVSAPDAESRLAILELCKRKMPFEDSLNLTNLVERTELFSGADLCNLCNEAALYAFTRNCDTDVISVIDFNAVLKELKPSLSSEQINWYNNFENKCIRKN